MTPTQADNLPTVYEHPAGHLMTRIAAYQYVRTEGSESKAKSETASPASACDCPLHACRNGKKS